jgi:hypothetical protein
MASGSQHGLFDAAVCPLKDAQEKWGPALWAQMHQRCAKFAEHPTMAQRRALFNYLVGIHKQVPCVPCADHWKQMFVAMHDELFAMTKTRESAFQMVYDLHSLWNLCLEKPIYSWSRALADYGLPASTPYEHTELTHVERIFSKIQKPPNLAHAQCDVTLHS